MVGGPETRSYAAQTYLLTSVRDFVGSVTDQMLADGMLLQDIRAVAQSVETWEDWPLFLEEKTRAYEALAYTALAQQRSITAGEHFARGAVCAHYGQFLFFEDDGEKRRLVDLKARLYRAAASLMAPGAARFEIPFGSATLPAYLRLPRGEPPFPLAILVGGLTASKEDFHRFSGLCLERGLATLSFDGPGQGEMFFRGHPLDASFRQALAAVIDHACREPGVDAKRIGLIGRSLGGFFACETAALDPRVNACAVWGALYDTSHFDLMPPLMQDGFHFATGASGWEDAKKRSAFVNLQGLAEKITCPLHVVHGLKDNVVPPSQAERVVTEAKGPKSLWLVPDSTHCSHDQAHLVRPGIADWMAGALKPV